ncbi:MAG: TIM barrel protein [Verrucomicrobiota bacterium]
MTTIPNSVISRRQFAKLGGASLATLALAWRFAPLAQAAGNKIPIGVQLYSVRKECEKDLPPVLEAIGKMGYKGVEYAGYYKRNAEELRKLMDANGLVCCGTHTAMSTIEQANLKATIEFNKTLGNKYLIVPSMPKQRAGTKQAWLDTAKYFNDVADQLKADGMYTGYHAHGGDFKPVEGEVPWDLFFGNTKQEVIMQLDTGNCIGGGADPVAVLKKYPGRARTIHLKESGGPKEAVIGGGDIKWKDVFTICETGGTQWYIVEHERGGPDPVNDIKRCLESLKAMGKA